MESADVQRRVADCEGVIKIVATRLICRKFWLSAGGCDHDDACQVGRMEVARIAPLHADLEDEHFRKVAAIAVRRRIIDLARNVAAQLGCRRAKSGQNVGRVKGTSKPHQWYRIDAGQHFNGYENGSDDSRVLADRRRREDQHTRGEFRAFLNLWCGLSAVERDIMVMRHHDELSMAEIAENLGLTVNRIWQIHQATVAKLKSVTPERVEQLLERAAPC